MKNPKIVFITEGLEILHIIDWTEIIPRIGEKVHFCSNSGLEKSWEVLEILYIYRERKVRITVR
jgi:hypothetical protein